MVKKNTEKRPEDWTREQCFNAIVACHDLTEEKISAYCRTQVIYAHHIDQWKLDFLGGDNTQEPAHAQQKVRQLSQQNQKLKRDLTRKDKALAETAALLVLQKKVEDIWSEEEISNVS
jgi:transposase